MKVLNELLRIWIVAVSFKSLVPSRSWLEVLMSACFMSIAINMLLVHRDMERRERESLDMGLAKHARSGIKETN